MKMECPDFNVSKCAYASCPHAGEHDETPDCAMGGKPWCPVCVAAAMPRTSSTMPQEPRNAHPYGFCPVCCAEGVLRECGGMGDDECANGHRYPSTTAQGE